MSKVKVLVTGASGFVGGAIAKFLHKDTRFELIAAARNKAVNLNSDFKTELVGDLDANTDWIHVLENVKVVVHTAARVHIMNDFARDPLLEYRRINVDGTLNLARQSINAKVHRFIFLSSIKVNGESTPRNKPFTTDSLPNPIDSYGIAKWEAEKGLMQLAVESDMEFVIIRSPLVYGPGVKANFQSMMRWLGHGVPLPLGSINNKRSLVGLDNLVDLIVACIEHPGAANQTFLAGDGEDLSTTELLQRVGNAMGKPARLITFPVGLLSLVALMLGKKDLVQRLCSSLQIDISKTRELLGWEPPFTVEEGLKKAAEDFINDLSRASQDL